MKISSSSFTLETSVLEGFNATLLTGKWSNVIVLNSVVMKGGPQQIVASRSNKDIGGCFDCSNCIIKLRGSRFEQVKGLSGGVVSTKYSQLEITECHFTGGTVSGEGGFIFAMNSLTYISNSSFSLGQAFRGGALYVPCVVHCATHITRSVFANNSAVQGGAVGWTKLMPIYSFISAHHNNAKYGNFEASLATHMALVPGNITSLKGVAGIKVVEPILIGFFDENNQLVATDIASSAELHSPAIIGTSRLIANQGVANFSSILIQSPPGQTLVIEVFSKSINETFPGSAGAKYSFLYEVRMCVPGEVSTKMGCYLCPKNTFSVNPSDSECTKCPHYASCQGGSDLVLAPGYWRPSTLSSNVHQCPIAEACEGGANSSCAEGYESVQCGKCSEGHYPLGISYCVACEAMPVQLLRLGLVFLVTIMLWMLLTRTDNRQILLVMKIIFEFCHSLIILPSINVNWGETLMYSFAVNEMVLSFGLSGLIFECLSPGTETPALYLKALAATLVPVLVLLGVAGMCLFRQHCAKPWRCYLFFFWLYRPYLLKSVGTMLACREESGKWLLAADVSSTCWDDTHQKFFFSLLIPVVLLTGVMYPLVLWILIRRKHPQVDFFVASYVRTANYTCLGTILRLTLYFVAVLCLQSVEDIMQKLFVVGVLYCFLHWHISKHPYEMQRANTMEGFSQLLQTYICAFSFYFSARLQSNQSVLQTLRYVLFLLILSYIVVCIVWLVRGRMQSVEPLQSSLQSNAVPPPSLVSQQSGNIASDLQLIELSLH